MGTETQAKARNIERVIQLQMRIRYLTIRAHLYIWKSRKRNEALYIAPLRIFNHGKGANGTERYRGRWLRYGRERAGGENEVCIIVCCAEVNQSTVTKTITCVYKKETNRQR